MTGENELERGLAVRAAILERLYNIAFGKANDAVKLVYMDSEIGDWAVDGLDLSSVAEVKRHANGTMEVKLLDRVEVMRLLLDELPGGAERADSGLDSLIAAIGEAARLEAKGENARLEDRENIGKTAENT